MAAAEEQGNGQAHRETFHIQNFPAELRRQVKVAAALSGMTMTEYVINTITPRVQRDLSRFAQKQAG